MARKDTALGSISLLEWILFFVGGSILFLILYGMATIPAQSGLGNLSKCLLLALDGILLTGLYALWTRLTERHWGRALELSRLVPDMGMGFLVGFVYFVVIFLIMFSAGMYRIDVVHFDGPSMAVSLMMFLVVAAGEEILFRGIVFRMIEERWNSWSALIVSALVFGFMHWFNGGATVWSCVAIAIEAGILLGVAYMVTRNLWLPIGIHWAWNFTQGNVFGFPVSGTDAGTSLIAPSITGPEWLTGGAFGAEASVIAAALGLMAALWMMKRN